jgi:small subunit ribosomal protein S21
MRRLKTKVELEGTLEEFRRIQAYETPKERSARKLRLRIRQAKFRQSLRHG